MSEQDFFFDDEPQAPDPASKAPRAPKVAPAAKSAAPATRAPRKTTAPAPAAQSTTSFVDEPTSWAVATLVGVCGLLLGLTLGFLLGNTLAKNAVAPLSSATPAVTAPAAVSGGGSTLTTAQMASGQLPAGHPKITMPATTTTAP